jgi:pyruvate/2-oxoglutarate dehydrogenase complex dihydrolipoamide acyltransferase (E2) component
MEITCPTMPDWAFERAEDAVVVRRWRKADGAEVRAGDIIAELETRLVSVELVAEAGGILRVIATQGTRVRLGDVLGTIDQPNDGTVWPPPPTRR